MGLNTNYNNIALAGINTGGFTQASSLFDKAMGNFQGIIDKNAQVDLAQAKGEVNANTIAAINQLQGVNTNGVDLAGVQAQILGASGQTPVNQDKLQQAFSAQKDFLHGENRFRDQQELLRTNKQEDDFYREAAFENSEEAAARQAEVARQQGITFQNTQTDRNKLLSDTALKEQTFKDVTKWGQNYKDNGYTMFLSDIDEAGLLKGVSNEAQPVVNSILEGAYNDKNGTVGLRDSDYSKLAQLGLPTEFISILKGKVGNYNNKASQDFKSAFGHLLTDQKTAPIVTQAQSFQNAAQTDNATISGYDKAARMAQLETDSKVYGGSVDGFMEGVKTLVGSRYQENPNNYQPLMNSVRKVFDKAKAEGVDLDKRQLMATLQSQADLSPTPWLFEDADASNIFGTGWEGQWLDKIDQMKTPGTEVKKQFNARGENR